MHLLTKIVCFGSVLAATALATEPTISPLPAKPWETSVMTVESGVLWEIGTGTPFPYRLLETQVSWKSAEIFGRVFADGSRVILRHRFAFIGAAIQQGPESHYFAVSASPSIEWWNAAGTWSLYGGSGGGFNLGNLGVRYPAIESPRP